MKCWLSLVLACGSVLTAQTPASTPADSLPSAILTPSPPPAPRINGPLVYGCRPTHPFLYRIPATGDRPMRFTAEGLPTGLALDPDTGMVTGSVASRGSFAVTLRARNAAGEAERRFTIVCGDTLALTPPMGWNDWYSDYHRVTADTVKRAADCMIANGMADAGYQYVDIDDCWENRSAAGRPDEAGRIGPGRTADGTIIPNQYFPDMKGLTDYLHARGLKAGIYSSPGPTTCGGYTASYGHEAQDARQYAAWGFDLLKYDWCSYGRVPVTGPKNLAWMEKPYRLMGGLIAEQPRDIVLNLCQYGMGDVWNWGADVGAQSWRSAGDLGPVLHQIFEVALTNVAHGAHQHPGAWNDPDYLQIGWIGDPRSAKLAHLAGFPPAEPYAYMALWSLMGAPLFYSGDLARMDAFTLNVLCNPEVIAVDQDPLGTCGHLAAPAGKTFVLIKELADGGRAVGLFNRGTEPATVTVSAQELGWTGGAVMRDLWREKDLGAFRGTYAATVPPRGVVLISVEPR